MSGLIIFSDGTTGIVGGDGWVEEFDVIDVGPAVLDGRRNLNAAYIDIEPAAVTDIEIDE